MGCVFTDNLKYSLPDEARAHQGNRNATAIAENCYQPELNTLN
jgi:hypothetical protein